MSTREKILASVRDNRPETRQAPVIDFSQVTSYEDPLAVYISSLEGIGGRVIRDATAELAKQEIKGLREKNLRVADIAFDPSSELSALDAASLESIHTTCIRAAIGVAENGAVWIRESAMGNRLLPFICQHLLIVLFRDSIVSTMHHAYKQISAFEEGFGVFLAGPSKTADIEQSLVIGAHGARSLTVYLINH